MKILALAFLALWFLPVPAPENHSEHTPKSNSAQTGKTEETKPCLPSVEAQNANDCQQCTNESNSHTANAYADPHKWLDRVNATSTVVIAIFAVITATAVAFQVRTARNTERAWITVLPYIWSPEFFPLLEDTDPTPEGPMGKHPMAHYFPAQIKNTGNTPARITGMNLRYIRTSTYPSQLSAEPEYGQLDVTERFLIKDEEMLGRGLLTPDDGTLTKAQINYIAEGRQFLYAYGIVKYSDVFNRSHETRFGYVYQIPQFYLVMQESKVTPITFGKAVFQHGGPPAYNRST